MKLHKSMCLGLWGVIFAAVSVSGSMAQTQLVRNDFFPAEFEFKELQKVRSNRKIDAGSPLKDVPGSTVLEEVGFEHYSARSYDITGSGVLSIEVVAASDEKAAFSLLTLLRSSNVVAGPPGESFASDGHKLVFVRGNYWVRIETDSPDDLARRVALSVSNRIGPREHQAPLLVSHLPTMGLEDASEKYFLGPKSFSTYADRFGGTPFDFGPEMEVAQAKYRLSGQSGLLSLIGFPTAQMAGDYFDKLAENFRAPTAEAPKFYTKKVGPLVGILEGTFDPANADKILGDIKFSYSIKWIYDKNNRSSATVWGVPVGILGTVVRSLLLTVLLCGMSVFLGVGMAAFRVLLRGYAPGNYLDRPERTEMIRLRLNEPPPLGESGGKSRADQSENLTRG